MNFRNVPTTQEARWLTTQLLCNKTVTFFVNGAGYRLTEERKVVELWLLGDNQSPLCLLSGRANILKPLDEIPKLIVQHVEQLEQEDKTMLEYGFKRTQRHRAYVIPLPLTKKWDGSLRLERTREGGHPIMKASAFFEGVQGVYYTWEHTLPTFPMAAVTFVRDELLLSVNAYRFLDRLRFYTTITSRFKDELLKNDTPLNKYWVLSI